MTWSLQLRNGDLVLGGASLSAVTSEQKLVQDLRCHILEKMGTDDLHPTYGSLLDGGTRPDGTYVPGFIGQVNSQLTQLHVEAELRRIVQDYQNSQLQRATEDRAKFGKTTFSKGEVLVALNSVDFVANQDALTATLNIVTGTSIVVQVPVSFTTV